MFTPSAILHRMSFPPEPAKPTQLRLFAGEATELEPGGPRPWNRHPWAWLLQRMFAIDVMTCPRCRGAMKLVGIANERQAIARVLATAGLDRDRGRLWLGSSS